jgi:tRNA pseudouridine55 synthase
VRLRLRTTAGFYVRALARDLGAQLGCGGHLAELRRTASGRFDVADAISLAEAERLGPGVATRVLSPADALSDLPAVRVTDLGLKRAVHGNSLGAEHLGGAWLSLAGAGHVRILSPEGALLAVAEPKGGVLQPIVVLGYN